MEVSGSSKLGVFAGDKKAIREMYWAKAFTKGLAVKILLRLLGICLLTCATFFLWFNSPYWMAGLWTACGAILLFYNTVRFMTRSEVKLTTFLQSIQQNDFSITFPENTGSDDYKLNLVFNQLTETYTRLRSEREEQHQLLHIIVEDAAVPMICFYEDTGKIYLTNQATKSLFNVPFLQDIDALYKIDQMLPNVLYGIKDGESNSFRFTQNGKVVFVSITSRHVVFRNQKLKLIALHDMSRELAAKESESWQKLLRVLTHEIANSAIPLANLSTYSHELLAAAVKENRELKRHERDDILESLVTIDKRSKSLKEFVENFKAINQIPDPVLSQVSVMELVQEAATLFSNQLKKKRIDLQIDQIDAATAIQADKNLTMQVLINLIKNAIEAINDSQGERRIQISTVSAGRNVQLRVKDSGCGILEEQIDEIFIPFYSTKPGGSGIGLSISKQIMQKQKADISVQSVMGKGSVFILSFPI